MKEMMVNGKAVKTNYDVHGNYPFSNGEDKKTMDMCLLEFRESDKEALKRLSEDYNKVTFYKVTTNVRGYYKIIAFCK